MLQNHDKTSHNRQLSPNSPSRPARTYLADRTLPLSRPERASFTLPPG